MNFLLLLPLLLPLLMATFSLLPRQWRLDRELLAVVGTAGHLISSLVLFTQVYQTGIIVIEVGNWPAPFGIVLVYDLLSCMMLVAVGLVGFSVALYSLGTVDPLRQAFGFFPLLHLLIMGCSGAFLAGDFFNLYVWFEVILIASFVLLTLGGEKHQMTGGVKYVAINLVSSTLFLIALGVLYAQMGTLNLADLALKFQTATSRQALPMLALLFFVVFGIKAALFPFFFWLPDSYHTPPVAVSTLFAGLLTKVGVYAFFRFFTLLFAPHPPLIHQLFLWSAGITMVVGVLGAWSQKDIRKILSFHIISQIGYMIMGLALFEAMAIAAALYFTLHNILAKSNLFLIAGVIQKLSGSFHVKHLGGLYHSFFGLSLLFLIPALSLAGIPPLSGFFGKFALVKAGLEAKAYGLVVAALAVSIITTLSMLKIWHHAFWQAPPADHAMPTESLIQSKAILILPIVFLASMTLILSLGAEFFLNLCLTIAEQLLHPEAYIQAVLKKGL